MTTDDAISTIVVGARLVTLVVCVEAHYLLREAGLSGRHRTGKSPRIPYL